MRVIVSKLARIYINCLVVTGSYHLHASYASLWYCCGISPCHPLPPPLHLLPHYDASYCHRKACGMQTPGLPGSLPPLSSLVDCHGLLVCPVLKLFQRRGHLQLASCFECPAVWHTHLVLLEGQWKAILRGIWFHAACDSLWFRSICNNNGTYIKWYLKKTSFLTGTTFSKLGKNY